MSSEKQVKDLMENISELKNISYKELTSFVKRSIDSSYPQKPTG